MRIKPACSAIGLLLLIVVASITGSAQFNQAKTPTPVNDGMESTLVKTGLYMISGDGGNSVVRLSANGIILVDGKLPENYDALRKRIKKISDQQIRVLILTGNDEARAGNNAKFLEDGTPIVSQANAKLNLASYNLPEKYSPLLVAYDRDYHIHLGAVDVQMMHFGSAHSSSDAVVYFPDLKAVVIGDLYAASPTPDFAAGGSLVGWGPVLDEVLKLNFDVAIPSTGEPITRAQVEAFKSKLDTLVSRATGLVNKGVSKDQLMSQLNTVDLGWQLRFTPSQLDQFYAELAQADHATRAAQLGVPSPGQR